MQKIIKVAKKVAARRRAAKEQQAQQSAPLAALLPKTKQP
jgi:hypothetical protein